MSVVDSPDTVPHGSHGTKITRKDVILGIVATIPTIILSILGIYYRNELLGISGIVGYSMLGMLIISFAAGSLLSFTAIPVPYWLFVFTLPSILAPKWGMSAPVLVALISALGATLGHMPTFFLGYGGSSFAEKVFSKFDSRFHVRALAWAKKHGAWASFLISAVFNPIHLPMTIGMGMIRYSPIKFFIFSFLGNTLKGLFLAFAGYYGINSILRFIGVS
jgi:membrane protein YqaA with SNARE-associated domain